MNHRAAQIGINAAARCREITHHASDERVAGASGVHHMLQRKSRRDKQRSIDRKNRAMLALFDDNVFRSELVDFARGFDEVVFLSELLRFRFIENEAIDTSQQFQQVGQRNIEP